MGEYSKWEDAVVTFLLYSLWRDVKDFGPRSLDEEFKDVVVLVVFGFVIDIRVGRVGLELVWGHKMAQDPERDISEGSEEETDCGIRVDFVVEMLRVKAWQFRRSYFLGYSVQQNYF